MIKTDNSCSFCSQLDWELVIVDDASPDDSADVARRIAARDPRVDVVVHGTNKGNIATFNEGLLDWVDGDYCLLLSADDRATPGALRRARDPRPAGAAPGQPTSSSSSAFWAWRRFSAWSQTAERSP